MPTRRLDDRIRQLCNQIAASGSNPAATDQDVETLLQELLKAIHQKVERLRRIAANKLLQGRDADRKDRRKSA